MEVSTRPFSGIQSTTAAALIGADDAVAQNEYSNSAEVALSKAVSGYVERVGLYTAETGTGAVLTPAGTLYLLSADPEASAGDAALTSAEWATVIGSATVASADWNSDAAGAAVHVDVTIPFVHTGALYAVFVLTSATGFNDAAGDDETLSVKLWYRPYA